MMASTGVRKVAAALPFLWGQNGEMLTPEQVKSRRAAADRLRAPEGYVPRGWASLIGSLAGEGVGEYKEQQADTAEKSGHAKVAEALAAARQSGDYMSVLGDEWATPQQASVAQALQSRAWSQEDQAKTWAREDARAAAARALAAQDAGKPKWQTLESGGDVYRYDANDPNSKPSLFFDGPNAVPEAPKIEEAFDPVTGRPIKKQWGGEAGWQDFGGVAAPKDPLAEVTVNNGGTDDFYKKLDTDAGAQQAALIDAGRNAASNNVRLQQVQSLLQNAPQGAAGAFTQFAGNLGIPVDGLNEVQAAQALINQMVPGQRPPGSGTMSDADLALFKQSLPAIINQPGGNKKIIETTLAINDYTMKQAAIAEKVANREISPAEGRTLQSQIPNPLAQAAPTSGGDDVENILKRYGL